MPDRDGIAVINGRVFCHHCDTWVLPSAETWHRQHCGPHWRSLYGRPVRETPQPRGVSLTEITEPWTAP